MGTYGMVWATAFVIGPPLGLSLFSANRIALWIICGVLGVLAATIISRRVSGASFPSQASQASAEKIQLSTS
jgi:hypothetical protein